MGFFKEKSVIKPEFQVLPEGEHIVRLTRAEEVDSFTQFSGEEKPELPEWVNATDQLAYTVVSAEEGKVGSLTDRLNGQGWKKMKDLTEKERKSGKFESIDGWACVRKNNKLYRVEDPEKTQICDNIAMQFASALGIEESEVEGAFGQGIEDAIEGKVTFRVTVKTENYAGKDQYRITRFKSVAQVVVDEFDD
jgi:hypothetical protein